MSGFTAIDLSRLPLPAAIEVLDFEAILAEMKATMIELLPEIAPVLELESEPVVKVLQIGAYREMILRGRINDAVRAVHLATATGSDLDVLAALFGVQRLVITAADPRAVPPVAEVLEGDAALRARTQLSLEGYSTAGPVGAYEFHALTADARVKDVSVVSPNPGTVAVTVLSRIGDGEAAPDLLAAVSAALNDERVRPLCDTVVVSSASIIDYAIEATLHFHSGPDTALVMQAATAALIEYVGQVHALGERVALSGILAALHRPGVSRVVLASPLADIVNAANEAANCTGFTLTEGVGP